MDSITENDLQRNNERFLALLVEIASSDSEPPFEIIRTLGQRFTELDKAARSRMASRPFSLIDFRLCDLPWWNAAAASLSLSPTPVPGDGGSSGWAGRQWRNAAVAIARSALVLAWRRGAADPMGATLSLGVCPQVVSIIGRMELDQLRGMADLHVEVLRPRWTDRPLLWQRLVDASASAEPREMDFVDRLAAQYLASDLQRRG